MIRCRVSFDCFLGTASKFTDAVTVNAIQEIVSSDALDPVAFRWIDSELVPSTAPIVT